MAVTSITHHYYMITNKFENLHALQSRINTRGLLSDARPSRPILAVKKNHLYSSPTNWTVIVVMLPTCCPVRFVMRSTLGQQQKNFGLGLTTIRPVLERIQGFLLRLKTRMIFYIDIFLARDTMVLRMSVYS